MTNDIDACEVTVVDPERVEHVRARLTGARDAAELAAIFGALSDPTRLRIVEALWHEELCVCDLSALLGLTQSTTSHHLRILRHLRLVTHRRAGKLVYYSLDDAHIGSLFTTGMEHVREATGGLD